MRVLAAAAMAALCAAPPLAIADQHCTTAKEVAAMVFDKVSDASEHTMRGAEAKVFMDRLNAMPPTTTYTADEVMIFTAPSKQPYALLVTLEHGCVNRHGDLPLAALRRLLGDGA